MRTCKECEDAVVVPGGYRCRPCHRLVNRRNSKARYRRRRETRLCVQCGKRPPKKTAARCQICTDVNAGKVARPSDARGVRFDPQIIDDLEAPRARTFAGVDRDALLEEYRRAYPEARRRK